jgi:hypothetical protein
MDHASSHDAPELVHAQLWPSDDLGLLEAIANFADCLVNFHDRGRSAGPRRRLASIAILLKMLQAVLAQALRDSVRSQRLLTTIRQLVRHLARPPARWAAA